MLFSRLACLVFAIVALVTGFATVSVAEDGEGIVATVERWAEALPIDDRVPGQVELYAGEKKKEFEAEYAPGLAEGIRERIFADISKQFELLVKGERSPFITVTVLDPGFATEADSRSLGKMETKFEKSFARTEVLAFFDNQNITPEEALRIYVDPDFRKNVSSRIKEIRKEGDETCLEMTGVKILLSPIKYCSRIDEFHREGVSIQHSQAIRNEGDDDYQTVYFKESLKAFIAVPGGLALYYINYSRTIGMGGIQKSIARKKIKESQQTAIDKLAARIDSYVPGSSPADGSTQTLVDSTLNEEGATNEPD